MAEIQSLMGLCPQDHIFFAELTGRQHIWFWLTFKGRHRTATQSDVEKLLDDVNLLFAADQLVKNYSGGMQRKLCVACSSIGDPEIIFLDEPTTGLDPVSRRHVWDFIQRLKKDRIVVLTTHSMEEADTLSDSVAILTNGRMRVMGTSLSLKNKFGSGFRLSFNVSETKSATVQNFVKERLPGAKLLVAAGTNLTVGVPRTLAAIMPEFLREIEVCFFMRACPPTQVGFFEDVHPSSERMGDGTTLILRPFVMILEFDHLLYRRRPWTVRRAGVTLTARQPM